MRFCIKAESTDFPQPVVRRAYVDAESGDAANDMFWTSALAPFPKLRETGFIPIAIYQV